MKADPAGPTAVPAAAGFDAPIPRKWLVPVRVAWLALALLLLALSFVSAVALFEQLRAPCSGGACYFLAVAPEEVPLLADIGLSLVDYAGYLVATRILFYLAILPLSLLIFWRKSDSWPGILLSLALLSLSGDYDALAAQYPGLQAPLGLLDNISAWLLLSLFFVFPDGRFVPRWTRLLLGVLIAGVVVDAFSASLGPAGAIGSPAAAVISAIALIIGVLAQIYRFRRVSTPGQRQQTKWVIFGLSVIAAGALIWFLLVVFFPLQPGLSRLLFNLGTGVMALAFLILPLSLTISILRYRLWDIDIIINRTLVYGLLTALLALIYLASVVLLQQILRGLTGQESPLAIVVATLLVAALFAPLRRRLQNAIDRRFYRRKYDAARTLAQFAATARDEVDLNQLTAELLRVIEKTMQPESVSLWLKEP